MYSWQSRHVILRHAVVCDHGIHTTLALHVKKHDLQLHKHLQEGDLVVPESSAGLCVSMQLKGLYVCLERCCTPCSA